MPWYLLAYVAIKVARVLVRKTKTDVDDKLIKIVEEIHDGIRTDNGRSGKE